jgi:hypothetical protein
MPDLTPLVGLGGAVGLFAAVGTVLIQLLRTNAQLTRERDVTIKQQADDIQMLKRDNALCNRRVGILIVTIQKHGIAVPPEVWDVTASTVRLTDDPTGPIRDRDN